MNDEGDFLSRLMQKLDAAQIPYMVTGSLASGFWGHPRGTNDFDILISPTETQLKTFLSLFGEDYYLSSEAALEAFRGRSMFNIIDHKTGWKADFIVQKRRAFDQEAFKRKQSGQLFGVRTIIASPEDAILSKLVWAKAADSERQMRDVLGIVQVQGERLDQTYMRRWAKDLGVEEILEKLLSEAERLG